MNSSPAPTCDLETVIITSELDRRPARQPDPEFETRTLLSLQRALANEPRMFFERLVNAIMKLTGPDSTGISLLTAKERTFTWPAIAGTLKEYSGASMPAEFGACGVVLERNRTLLMHQPSRYFTHWQGVGSHIEEVLLVPFHQNGVGVGTLWSILHTPGRKFDAEDRRLLEALSGFAASAYQTLAHAGSLTPWLNPNPE